MSEAAEVKAEEQCGHGDDVEERGEDNIIRVSFSEFVVNVNVGGLGKQIHAYAESADQGAIN